MTLIDTIIAEVEAKHRVGRLALLGRCRIKHIMRARQELYWRLREETKLSWPALGRVVGNRDHTTVLTGARVHAAREGLNV